jgi:hypothetical protein
MEEIRPEGEYIDESIVPQKELREHNILIKHDKNGNELCAIEWTTSPYKGIIFVFDKVEFLPVGMSESLRVKFNYDILREPQESYVTEDLVTELGDFLMLKIAQQLSDNELIYHGGVNETPLPTRDD